MGQHKNHNSQYPALYSTYHTYLLPFLLTIAFFSLAPKAIGSASLAAFSISAGSAKYELAYRS